MKTAFSLILAFLLFNGFAALAQSMQYIPRVANDNVIILRMDLTDTQRNRTVPVKIYAPATITGQLPVILFSHGLGGSREGYEYLGQYWAGCGYVSVHLQHPGSDSVVWQNVQLAQRMQAMQKAGKDLRNLINRPLDVSFVINELERLNEDTTFTLYHRLNLSQIGMSGHSFGGYTTLAVSGMTFVLPRSSKNFGDPRIKAAIQMSAPGMESSADLNKAFGSITIPLMHMTGTKDVSPLFPETTAEDRRVPFDHMSNSKTCLVNFIGGDHMIFSGEKRAVERDSSQDAIFHQLICTGTVAFWDAYLKGEIDAQTWLVEGGYKNLLGENATFEVKTPIKTGE